MDRRLGVVFGSALVCLALSGCGSSAAQADTSGGCQYTSHADAEGPGGKKGADSPVIKGYILSNTGEKVYYIPGSQGYKRARIDESKGMKYFCTEKDAEAAGWRKATV